MITKDYGGYWTPVSDTKIIPGESMLKTVPKGGNDPYIGRCTSITYLGRDETVVSIDGMRYNLSDIDAVHND